MLATLKELPVKFDDSEYLVR